MLIKCYLDDLNEDESEEQIFVNDLKEYQKEGTNVAKMRMALMFSKSKRKYLDYKRAFKLFKEVYDNIQNVPALDNMALILLNEESEMYDEKEGMRILNLAVEKGSYSARTILSGFYEFGKHGLEMNEKKAYDLLIEASKYDDKALILLGDAYMEGFLGLHIDPKKGDEYYLKAGKHSPEAYISMGDTYTINLNFFDALKWYQKAYDFSTISAPYLVKNTKGEAAYSIARNYRLLSKDEPDLIKEALKWYDISFKLGYYKGIYEVLSLIHDSDNPYLKDDYFFNLLKTSVKKNAYENEPFYDYEESACIYSLLGEFYLKEEYKDYDKALKCFKEAQKQDDENEMNILYLALCYYFGYGTKVNVTKFRKLLNEIDIDYSELNYAYLDENKNNPNLYEIALKVIEQIDTY